MSAARHAIVIGSGFGGLAAAVRLGARGYQVTVLEKLDAPGGRAYVHRQQGYTFDAGPTIVTAPYLLDELWALCGRNRADDVELRELDPFYQVRFDDGDFVDYSETSTRSARRLPASSRATSRRSIVSWRRARRSTTSPSANTPPSRSTISAPSSRPRRTWCASVAIVRCRAS